MSHASFFNPPPGTTAQFEKMGFLDNLIKSARQPQVERYRHEAIGSFLYRKAMHNDELISTLFFREYPKKRGSDIEAILFVSSLVHVIMLEMYPSKENEIMSAWYVRMMEDLQNRNIKQYFIEYNLPENFINKRLDLYYNEWMRVWDTGYYPRDFLLPLYQTPLSQSNSIFIMDSVFKSTKLIPAMHNAVKRVDKVISETIK